MKPNYRAALSVIQQLADRAPLQGLAEARALAGSIQAIESLVAATELTEKATSQSSGSDPEPTKS